MKSKLRGGERPGENDPFFESEAGGSRQSSHAPGIDLMIEALCQKMPDIARSEMARRRGRLGELTSEQEHALEVLLISTVNKISRALMQNIRWSDHKSMLSARAVTDPGG